MQLMLWASLAALSAVFGPLCLRRHEPLPLHAFGWANALAAGAMLGVAYSLMHIGVERGTMAVGVGAVLGIGVTYAAHILLGVGAGIPPIRPPRAVGVGAVHAAPEGIAMGAAMALGMHIGLFLILTLAVHNVWESAVLASRLIPGGVSRRQAGALGVAANVPQVVFASVAYALVSAKLVTLPFMLGLAFGALTYLCFAELLPDSYRSAGRTSIAVVVSVAAGVVALVGGST